MRMPAQVKKNTHKQNTVHLTDMLGFFGVVFFIYFVCFCHNRNTRGTVQGDEFNIPKTSIAFDLYSVG